MYEKWLKKHTESLESKWVAVSGATGGIGKPLCHHLAKCGASLILLDRNATRSHALADTLRQTFAGIRIQHITVDMSDITSVKAAANALQQLPVDILIHNAGAYSIPRCKTAIDTDNVFQINCVSPYYLTKEMLPFLRERKGTVIAVGSIAHRYSKTDPTDPDFSKKTAASKVYGNAKRHLMLALYALFANEKDVALSIVHPGITFTNITAHYPKWMFAITKHPMKVIFMQPKKAALSVVKGVFSPCAYSEWIGPALLDVWGLPKKKTLRGLLPQEFSFATNTAEQNIKKMKECAE